ncbi:MAG: ABC transporter permease [Candidatus Aminicenantes bacterium]|nr:ABC transporter permease [Candidatus Aminicenantes bacterium]
MTQKTEEPRLSRFSRWLIRRIFKDEGEAKLGDFMEIYSIFAEEKGRLQAKLRFWWYLIRSIPKYFKDSLHMGGNMFKNYIKIAFRNLRRNKGYSTINITGLIVGIVCFVLMFLYVRFELSFDHFHINSDQIYRFYKKRQAEGTAYLGNPYFTTTPAPLAPALKDEFPEVVNATRISSLYNTLLIHQKYKFYENGLWADNQFLQIFSFPLRQGNPEEVLAKPHSMVVTERLAERFFGSKDPTGEIITFHYGLHKINFQVTGILKNIPANSHLHFDFLASFINLKDMRRNGLENWYSSSDTTYIQLQHGYDYKALENKLPVFLNKYAPERYAKYAGFLQPLKKIHLHSFFNFDIAATNDINNIYIFTAIALIILIIACINYMNLATARSFQRAKEVGMRKVMGAARQQIIRQFLGEAVFLSGLALFGALVLVKFILPLFNSFTQQNLQLNILKNPGIIFVLFAIVILVGHISGSYPAVFLSSVRPIKVLKKEALGSSKGAFMRNILVIFQFSASIILIVCTIVVYGQLKFIKNKDMGFSRDNIVTVRIRDFVISKNIENLKNTLLEHPNVKNISTSESLPLHITNRSSDVKAIDESKQEVNIPLYYSSVDFDYLDTFDIKLLLGRNFAQEFSMDKEQSLILNETAVSHLRWENPIGKRIQLQGKDFAVIGVVKDFHYQPMHLPIEPMALYMEEGFRHSELAVRMSPDNIPQTIAFLKKTYEQYQPLHPFEFTFLDDSFNRIYQREQIFGSIFRIFSFLAIFIACLGLYGLASFTAERRTKEIGIRKVLGASISGIFMYFSLGLSKCVLLANLIAWPIAYYLMDKWLQSFAYRMNLNAWPFILSGLAAFLIALLTISYQSVKAATANPVDSLRYE